MSKPASSSAALPIAYVVLRILIILNWLMGSRDPRPAGRDAQRAMDHVRVQAFSFA